MFFFQSFVSSKRKSLERWEVQTKCDEFLGGKQKDVWRKSLKVFIQIDTSGLSTCVVKVLKNGMMAFKPLTFNPLTIKKDEQNMEGSRPGWFC